MESPSIDIIETVEEEETSDDCQYCAGRSIC
jgi:hypothetical protein